MPHLRIKANIQMGAFIRNYHVYGSQDSIVGIVTCYGLDGLGFKPQREARFSVPVQTGTGVHAASFTLGTGSLSCR
jgi:hypothetical protein